MKVGDRVRYTGNYSTHNPGFIGREGTVTHTGQRLTSVTWDDSGNTSGHFPDNLEVIMPLRKFKIWDRVRYTGKYEGYSAPDMLGLEGVVTSDSLSDMCYVKWDKDGIVKGAYLDNLELIMTETIDTTKPLQLRYSALNRTAITFITETSDGNLLIEGPDNSGWMIYDKAGKFVRAKVDSNRFRSWNLENVSVETVNYIRLHMSGDRIIAGGTYDKQENAESNGDQVIKITSIDNKVIAVELLK